MIIRDIKILTKIISQKYELGLPLDSSINDEFENIVKHKNFIFSNGIDLIYEIFNFNKDSNDSNFNNFLKRIGKNKIFTDAVMKVADGGFRSY